MRDFASRPISERNDLEDRARGYDTHWGFYWAELGYTMGPHFDQMTLAEAAEKEMSAIERILARALPHEQ
jgi:hypothetical protein